MERDRSIDIAKGLGIMMVVCCHANFAPLSPFRFFHMALFFFLTGWLQSFNKPFKTFILSKIRHLYLPFVAVEAVFLLLHSTLLTRIGLSVPYTVGLPEIILRIALFDNLELFLAPLWFMPVLFFVNCLSYIMIHLMRRRRWLLLGCSLLLMIIGLYSTRHGWMILPAAMLKQGVNVVLVAQFFAITGYLLRQMKFRFDNGWIAAVGLVYLYVAKLVLGLSVDMRVNAYSNVALWILAVCAGIYLTMYSASWLSDKGYSGLLAYLGEHSLLILMLHIFCFKLVGLIQVYAFGYDLNLLPLWENLSKRWYWALAYSIAGLSIPALLRYCYDKTITAITNLPVFQNKPEERS